MPQRLYVGNLPYTATAHDLLLFFASYGTVPAATVITDKMTGRSKGFGFVEMSNMAETEHAVIEGHGHILSGRAITVTVALSLESRAARSHGNSENGTRLDGNSLLPGELLASLRCPRHVINVSAAVNRELLRHLANEPTELRSPIITSRLFEEIVAEIWAGFGYTVELTQTTRDGGYDVVAIRDHLVGERFLIECKKPRGDKKISIEPVRALHGVKAHVGATKAILATTAHFTRDATLYLNSHRWELEGKDFDGIHDWLVKYNLLVN